MKRLSRELRPLRIIVIGGVLMSFAAALAPARADDDDYRDYRWREHEWREHQRREHEWRERERREHWDHRYWDRHYEPGVEVYSPPPVYYDPPPPAGVGFVFRLGR